MDSASVDINAWTSLVLTINELILEDTLKGLFVIFLSLIIFFTLIVIAVWAITKIVRANKENPKPTGEIFNRDQFTLNILTLTETMTKLTLEGRELSAKHERVLEHTITRDQMTVVDTSLENLKSVILISFNKKVREMTPKFTGTVKELSVAKMFEHSLDFAFEEVIKFFRRIAKENHLADRSERDFDDYCEQKLIAIKNHGRRVFESIYTSDILPINSIILKYEENWPEYSRDLKSILKSMRNISISYRNQIKEEEEEFQTRWTSFTSSIHDTLSKGIVK